MNRNSLRLSKDIDVFNDLAGNDNRVRLLAEVVAKDRASLEEAGFGFLFDAERAEFFRAIISKAGEQTILEWTVDSDYRFFEAVADDEFGYRLDIFDLATNKVLAAASRKEPRDLIDLLHLHASGISLPSAIWAAPAKDPGFTPESLIEDLRRNCVYVQDDFDRVITREPVDARMALRLFKQLLKEAEEFVAAIPSKFEGAVFLQDGRPVQPDLSRLHDYEVLRASRQGHWPSSAEIGSEMIGSARSDPKP